MTIFLICLGYAQLFIRGTKLSISFVFITQSYFAVSKNIRLNSTPYFVMKIPSKRELQEITFNHSSDTHFYYISNLVAKAPHLNLGKQSSNCNHEAFN